MQRRRALAWLVRSHSGPGGAPDDRDHRAQHVASVLGQAPGGGRTTAAEEYAVKVRSDNDG
jgi:hypothetical protein